MTKRNKQIKTNNKRLKHVMKADILFIVIVSFIY